MLVLVALALIAPVANTPYAAGLDALSAAAADEGCDDDVVAELLDRAGSLPGEASEAAEEAASRAKDRVDETARRGTTSPDEAVEDVRDDAETAVEDLVDRLRLGGACGLVVGSA